MVPSVKQAFGHRSASLQPCCDYSQLVNPNTNKQNIWLLWICAFLLSSFFATELAMGWWSGSLALQADAGHMLSDVSALVLTSISTHFAAKPASNRASFGHQRVEIFAALANSIALLAIAAFIGWEAINQLRAPMPVMGLPMLVTAGVGLIVNSINISLLHKPSQNNINLRGAFLHMVADAASSVGTILAALAIYFWNWTWVDALTSLLVACFIIYNSLPILQQSWEILMEYAPQSIDPVEVEAFITSFNGVERVEKLHIWAIGSNRVALAAHLIVNLPEAEKRDRLLRKLQVHLQEFGIGESTLQLTGDKTMEEVALHPLLNSNLIDLFARKNQN